MEFHVATQMSVLLVPIIATPTPPVKIQMVDSLVPATQDSLGTELRVPI